MAGLLKDEFVSEVMTELSWIMRVIDDLCVKKQDLTRTNQRS